jgi:hypothetical protein
VSSEVEKLMKQRADLELRIAALENERVALYMPGITLVPQQGALPTGADQEIEQLRAAIVEIDAQIASLSGA